MTFVVQFNFFEYLWTKRRANHGKDNARQLNRQIRRQH